ncbi:MAG: DUF4263 domain-containing protein [Anaerolineae bacterium]|nr:DUF4263 domain-containing protein [Anaerolineae bacterium]
MSDQEKINQAKALIEELSGVLRELSDNDAGELFDTGILGTLLGAILEPSDVENFRSVAEFILANRMRASYIAVLQRHITHAYSFRITRGGETYFASPSHIQWFDDGVMLLDAGNKPFSGLLALFRQGKLSYPIAKRDTKPGEAIGRDDFEFLELQEFERYRAESLPKRPEELDQPVMALRALINEGDNDEGKYQKLLSDYPWVLGAQYKVIQRHEKLDDRNIPDFTGVRVHDKCRDIFEIKPPFMNIFRQNGKFTSAFNDAWDQAERYWDFANRNRDYLFREKGLRFENPKCILILGSGLSSEDVEKLRRKERSNPAIEVRTYDDLLKFMTNTVVLLKQLGHESE